MLQSGLCDLDAVVPAALEEPADGFGVGVGDVAEELVGERPVRFREQEVTDLGDVIGEPRSAPPSRVVAGLGMGDLAREAGAEVVELDWWQSVTLGPVRVHCVPAQHFSGRSLVGRDRRLWAGWVVEGPERRFYHAGDTGYFRGFREIGERLGPIDLAALPIGAYDPPEIMRFVHLDPEEAVRAHRDVSDTGLLVPIHWATFRLAPHPWSEPVERMLTAAAAEGVAVATPRPGEQVSAASIDAWWRD